MTTWDVGTWDAGSVSTDTTLLIWNNRGGTTAVSDMINCTITTKDSAGGDTGELVVGRWIEVKVDSMNETTFTPVGGGTTKTIQGGGSAGAGTIKGTVNNGADTNVTNYAKVTLHANVPTTATAGNVDFLTRVAYQFT
ncbi:putative phage protein [Paenibacillus illinoisensis]|uniref:Putative phage protein n=1 Tax=Paenibacillus illinoisensis TaxID=59845 RepID=A0A2W0C8L3_9BACL|nr:putative phage protein [Paenibacillus illinoisensis]